MKKLQGDLLLFDIDGVIVDSFEQIYRDVLAFIQKHGGQGISQDEFRKMFENNALAKVLAASGLSPTDARPNDLRELFLSYHETKIFAEMEHVLRDLAKSHILVAITSSAMEPVMSKLEQYGLGDVFAAYLGPETAVHKDAKIRMALDEFGSQTNRAFFISDTLGDIFEAKKAGVKTIAVTWGYHKREIVALGVPDFIVQTPAQLLQLFRK